MLLLFRNVQSVHQALRKELTTANLYWINNSLDPQVLVPTKSNKLWVIKAPQRKNDPTHLALQEMYPDAISQLNLLRNQTKAHQGLHLGISGNLH